MWAIKGLSLRPRCSRPRRAQTQTLFYFSSTHLPIHMEKLNNNGFIDFRETVCWVGVGVIKSFQKIKT